MDLFDFLEESQKLKVDLKPWMSDGVHKAVLCTAEMLPKVIDDCIASGLYGLDTEGTGLDTRVFDGETVAKLVGCSLSSDGKTGYYIPLRHKVGAHHNVPWSLWKREMARLLASDARAIFHNAKYDQEMLQFCGSEPVGEWDDPKKWEDTLILAYLRDTRAKQKGLKFMAKTVLDMEMIELDELFPKEKVKAGELDFSELDPSWEVVPWYAGSDALITRKLYDKIAPQVLEPGDGLPGQSLVYNIEKLCVAATRWMERARIMTDQDKARELIRIGQKEWLESITEVYTSASEIVGRDISPGYYRILMGRQPGYEEHKFDANVVQPGYMVRVDEARLLSDRNDLDPSFKDAKKKVRIQTLTKRVASIASKGTMEEVDFPVVYDILVPEELGALLRECKVPGLTLTEKSGQVATNQEELERVLEEAGDKYPFAAKIKRFREVSKALGTYLLPLIEDCAADGSIRIHYNAHKIDTGRFAVSSSKNPARDGGTRFPIHGTPATYDPKRPECMGRIRECIIARPGKVITAIDFSGVELRIATNLSLEPKWLREFFHCSSCDRMFPGGDGTATPMPPPPFCPDCGSDKIGDLHTLTGLSIYGADATSRPDWKKLRGNSKCVHPDTLILHDGSLKRIGDLPFGDKDTFLPVGGTTQGPQGPIPLVDSYNGGVKSLFHVVTRRGIVTCTDQHRFQTLDGGLLSISSGLGKGIQLKCPDVPVVLDHTYKTLRVEMHDDVPALFYVPGNDDSYFAGMFQGDGCKDGTRSVAIAHGDISKTDLLGVAYTDWQKIIESSCKRIGLRPVSRSKGVYLGSRNTMRFFSALGLLDFDGGRTLRIPSWVLSAGRESGLHYLAGLWDTDGYVSKKDGCGAWTTKDIMFASQVCSLASSLGLFPRVEASWNKTYLKFYWRVFLSSGGMYTLGRYLRHPGKLARVKPPRQTPIRKPNEVLDIIPAGEGPCVDLHVGSEDHLFWCNGLISRNSTNFALVYGGGGNAVVLALEGEIDKAEGWRIKEVFDGTYKGLSAWWKTQHKFARQHKFVVTSFGRRYPLPDIDHEMGGFRSKAERNAVNGPIQGNSADITKLAMGLIYKECKKRGWLEKVHMLVTMHDELVFEIDKDILEEAIDIFVNIMCRNPALLRLKWPVPLTSDVEMGYSWMVPWDLKKIRHTGKCPPELEGCFNGTTVKSSSKEEVKVKTKTSTMRIYKILAFTLGAVEGVAAMIARARDAKPSSPAVLKVEGPEGEDLTGMLQVVWGGPLPEVEADGPDAN